MKPQLIPFQDWTPDTAPVYNEGMNTVQNCMPYLAKPNYSQSLTPALSAIGIVTGGTYTANATKFDGSTNYLSAASNLTGIADGKSGSASLWVRIDGGTTASFINIAGSFVSFNISWGNAVANKFSVVAKNSSGTQILLMTTDVTYSPGITWYNILMSWNLATAATNLYVNNVSHKTTTTAINDTINYTLSGAPFDVGFIPTIYFNGCLSEVWFDTSFIDFSNATNRAKFIDSNGYPVNLGSTGQTPTGSSPLLYLKSAASSIGTNSGTGGNLTANGVFSIASSSPSGAAASQNLGAFAAIDSNDISHTYIGNATALGEITATASNNLSKSGGYTCNTFWKGAQFTSSGTNNIYMTDLTDNIQVMAVGGTQFADLGGSPPKAQHIGQINQFIMLAKTNGGTIGGVSQGAVPNRVWWCQIGNPASWPDPLTNAGIADQAGFEDLPAIYGECRHVTNGQFWNLVFQEHSITRFTYVGGADVFSLETFEKQRGLYCHNGACQVGQLVYFPDASGFWMTDGFQTIPIGHDMVDKTWLADVDTAYLDHVRASHDVANKCIWWAYKSTSATLLGSFVPCDKVIVYNYQDKRWGMGYVGQSIDIIFDSHTLAYTMEQLDSINSNLDLIVPSLDSPYWNGGNPIIGMFGIQQIQSTGTYASYYGTFSGSAGVATLTTKTFNPNPGGRSLLTAVKPVVVGASLPNVSVFAGTQTLLSDAITYNAGSTPETRTGKCSMRVNGVYHTEKVTINGTFTNAMGIEPEFTPAGVA